MKAYPIELDKPRTLRFTIDEVEALETRLGVGLDQLWQNKQRIVALVALLYRAASRGPDADGEADQADPAIRHRSGRRRRGHQRDRARGALRLGGVRPRDGRDGRAGPPGQGGRCGRRGAGPSSSGAARRLLTPWRAWRAQVEPIAYSDLGLRPWEFGALTPREFGLLLAGHRTREEDGWLQIAALGCWVTAPHIKTPLKPEQLLGWPADWQQRRREARRRAERNEMRDGDHDGDAAEPGIRSRRLRRRD